MSILKGRSVFVLLLGFLGLLVGPSHAATIQVPEDQPTIQDAINASVAGDVIDVAPGTYVLPTTSTALIFDIGLVIDKPITLKSRELYQAILDGAEQPYMVLIQVKAAAHIEGFIMRDANRGILQYDSPNVTWTARNLIIENMQPRGSGNGGVGIDINDIGSRIGSADISNIVVSDCVFGFGTNDADGFTIRNSVVNNCSYAFLLHNHNFLNVTNTATFRTTLTVLRSSSCVEEGGTVPCPISLGTGFLENVNPQFVDVSSTRNFPYFLSCSSPLVDAGDPSSSFNDVLFPPSLGTATNDIGAYGGPGASVVLSSVEQQDMVSQAGCAPHLSCVGFDPPLASGPVTVKKNRVLPLKAELFNEGTPVTNLDIASAPVIQVIFNPGVGPAIDVTADALPVGQGTDGNQFEFSDQKWRFNLKTGNYTAAGTYNIQMLSGDELEYGVESCQADFVIED